MVAQQLHGLVDEFGFLFPSRRFIAPAQLLQNLYSGRLTHVFIHSGQGNPTFGTTNGLSHFLTPSRVTKLLAQFATPLQTLVARFQRCATKPNHVTSTAHETMEATTHAIK